MQDITGMVSDMCAVSVNGGRFSLRCRIVLFNARYRTPVAEVKLKAACDEDEVRVLTT